MSEEEYYYSEQSNSGLSEEAPSSSNEYFLEENVLNEEEYPSEEYIYDYEYPQQYIVEEIPYIIPRAQKQVVWSKRPNTDGGNAYSRPKKRPASPPIEEALPILEFHGASKDSTTSTNNRETNKPVDKKTFINFYLQDVEKRGNTFMSKRAKKSTVEPEPEEICKRLDESKSCDTSERQCSFSTCHRKFVSIEVLAYHISYAHQQISSRKAGNQICMVCGKTFSHAQGKLTHMAFAHKELAMEHEKICRSNGPITIDL